MALRALGHEIDAKENEALKLMFPDGTIIFGDYLKLLSEWIFNIDQDLDVEKAFSLFDTDGKGYIDFDDLRRVRDRLGYSQEIDDTELIDMLIGSQVCIQECSKPYFLRFWYNFPWDNLLSTNIFSFIL